MRNLGGLLKELGIDIRSLGAGDLVVRSPIDGQEIARLKPDTKSGAAKKIARADEAFRAWRQVPAPRRGELIRLFGEELRAHKDALAAWFRSRPARYCRRASAKCRR